MKEKGDQCIFVGYSTTSKGYRVYNKRTKLIYESIHINFDEIKEFSKASAYDNSGPVPQLQNLSFERYNTKIIIQDHNNEPSSLKLVPNGSPPVDKTDSSLQELDFLFSPLFEEYFTAGNQSVSKPSALFDNCQQQNIQPTMNVQPKTEPITPTTTIHAKENNTNQATDARGSLLALKCLVWFMKYYANVRRTVADFSHAPLNEYSPSPDDKKQWSLVWGKPIQKLRQKGVYEESFSRHAAWIGGKLIQFMHTTMVPVQVKTMKIQAGIQVLRRGELRRQLQLLGTPMATKPKLDADLSGLPVDQRRYRSMIRSLMYLTSSTQDIVQAVCYCAHYQARPTKKHLKEVKNADHAECLDTHKALLEEYSS
ncbi:retrovirus-related pol polyprotein from transposon TNT 1-94 [Tanacetum coccineum]